MMTVDSWDSMDEFQDGFIQTSAEIFGTSPDLITITKESLVALAKSKSKLHLTSGLRYFAVFM